MCILEPLLDGVERVDRDGVDHGDLLAVVLVHDDHVEVLQVELHALKVHQLHLVQSHHKRRLAGKRRDTTALVTALVSSTTDGKQKP